MKESDYIKIVNQVHLSSALHILRDVLATGDGEYGVKSSELREITRLLFDMQSELLDSIDTEE